MKNNPKELIDDLKVIRTIHSNKARLFGVYNFYYLIITVVIAVIVTFIGFSGPESIADLFKTTTVATNDSGLNRVESTVDRTSVTTDSIGFSGAKPITNFHKIPTATTGSNSAKLVMDLMTLSILVISILGLILRFDQKANKHNNAVTRLTEFISQVEFTYLGGTNPNPTSFAQADVGLYAEKYKSIINSLPPTKDSDYIDALKTIKRKKKIKAFIESVDYDNKNYFTRKWYILWI